METQVKSFAEPGKIINEQSTAWKGIEILHDNSGAGGLFRETGIDTDPLAGDPRGPAEASGTAVSVTTRGKVITIDLYAVRRYR